MDEDRWGPITMDYGKLAEAASQQARCCASSAPHERSGADVSDYSREADYSNLLILEIGNRSVKICIPISPDNCKHTRVNITAHHIVLLKVPVRVTNRQKSRAIRTSQLLMQRKPACRWLI